MKIGMRLLKAISGITLTLFMLSIFTSMVNFQSVFAFKTIYIRPDGSIDPSIAPIQRDGEVYSLTDNVHDKIVIMRNNIIFDGKNKFLQGSGNGNGFEIIDRNNVTIKNVLIENFDNGIYFFRSKWSMIEENIISNNHYAIYLDLYSSYNSIDKNVIKNNDNGVIYKDECNSAYKNIIKDNKLQGIIVESTTQTFVIQNNITNNGNCGIIFTNSFTSILDSNIVSDNDAGIVIFDSSNIYVENNKVINNEVQGIVIDYGNGFNVEHNHVEYNNDGISLISGERIHINNNKISNNDNGIYLTEGVTNSYIRANNLSNNKVGIYISSSQNNLIWHNNFLNNKKQVSSYDSYNSWDDGYPNGGNFWDDYTGVDLKSGEDQDQNGSDYIGDYYYYIESGNIDRYPLMVSTPINRTQSTLTCGVSLSKLRIGESVTIFGILSPDLAGKSVLLTYQKPDESVLRRTVITSSNSSYSDFFEPKIAGDWSVTASWDGEPIYLEATSSKVPFTVLKQSTSVTLDVSPPNITIGNSVNIFGSISPARENSLSIWYKKDTYHWIYLGTIISNSNGSYSFLWTPTSSGMFPIRVQVDGNSNYYGEGSHAVSLTVNKILTTLFCSVSSSQITEDNFVTVSGYLSPIFLMKKSPLIIFQFKKPSGSKVIKYIRTDLDGNFSYSYSPKEIGYWTVTALWDGDDYHTSAISQTMEFTYGDITGDLKVIVRDEKNNAISDTYISSTSQPSGHSPLSGITISDGSVRFSDVAPGSYTFQASKSGYATKSGTVSAKAGETTEITITLEKKNPLKAIPGFPYESIMLGLTVGILVLWILKKRQ